MVDPVRSNGISDLFCPNEESSQNPWRITFKGLHAMTTKPGGTFWIEIAGIYINGKQEAISSVQNKAVTFQYTDCLIGIQNTIHHHNLSKFLFWRAKKIRIKT